MPLHATFSQRRRWLLLAGAAAAWLAGARSVRAAPPGAAPAAPERRWFEAAQALRLQALSQGDQPYGAVLLLAGSLVGEGPSRVVQKGDASAHAEREAIRDAQQRLGRQRLTGSVLVSTSRPCAACEAAAAAAGVSRMWFGQDMSDAGVPRDLR